MRHVLQGVLSALMVFGLGAVAAAETTNAMNDNARERNQISTESQQRTVGTDAGEQKSIETQGATKRRSGGMNQDREVIEQNPGGINQDRDVTRQEPVGIVDQLKEGAKGEVDRRGKDVNERIDALGR